MRISESGGQEFQSAGARTMVTNWRIAESGGQGDQMSGCLFLDRQSSWAKVARFIWRFSVVILPVLWSLSDGFLKQNHWFRSTIPLISFNDSIGFAERFQWNCSFNLTVLRSPYGALAVCICRFWKEPLTIWSSGVQEMDLKIQNPTPAPPL